MTENQELSTKRLWDPERWNSSFGRGIGSKEDAKTLNAYLDLLGNKVYQTKKQILDNDQQLTAELLKNILIGKSEAKRMILEIFSASQ